MLQHLLLSVTPGNLLLHQKYCEMFLSKTHKKKEREGRREIGGRCWRGVDGGGGMGRRERETVSGVIVLVFFSSFSEASDSVWLWLSCSLVITEEGGRRGGEGN